jgi:hypothetical protein
MAKQLMNITNPGPSISNMSVSSFAYINSAIGMKHLLPVDKIDGSTTSVNLNGVFTGAFASYIKDIPSADFTTGLPSNSSVSLTQYDMYTPSNPWKLTTNNFTTIST